jgi:hypothetical protein
MFLVVKDRDNIPIVQTFDNIFFLTLFALAKSSNGTVSRSQLLSLLYAIGVIDTHVLQ